MCLNNNEPELKNIAIELFETFARFEYSLKAAGFHNGEGPAEPNWRRFAESVSQIFENPDKGELCDAIQYILVHPPKKQFISKELMEWREVTPETNLKSDLVLLYVRRVRNNLFHGGKFNNHWFEPERDEHLLMSSLAVLKACLKASERVRYAYEH